MQNRDETGMEDAEGASTRLASLHRKLGKLLTVKDMADLNGVILEETL